MFELEGKDRVQIYPTEVSNNPIVSVCVQTYNHENYIRECLDGILMQECNFDFEILLGEDDSSDNTRKICIEYAEKYPENIRLFLHDRKNVIYINGNATGRFNMINNLKSARGKYIAFCEGDDYWTDPLKLQKQVDFLNGNPDFIVCGTEAVTYSEEEGKIIKTSILGDNINQEYHFEDLIVKNRFITNTVVFKNLPFVKGLPDWFKKVPFGDWPLYTLLTQYGKGINLGFTSGVYREHGGGVYSSSSNFNVNFNHALIYKIFWVNFEKSKLLLKPIIQKWLLWSMYSSHSRKQEMKALKVYIDTFKFQTLLQKTFYKMLLEILNKK